jgi:hypothetical protein
MSIHGAQHEEGTTHGALNVEESIHGTRHVDGPIQRMGHYEWSGFGVKSRSTTPNTLDTLNVVVS